MRNRHEEKKCSRDGGFELSFLVIGAQKAGTSWLHSLLQKCNHSRISLPMEQKEVHFWDWHYRKGFQWYIRQFNFPTHKKKVMSSKQDLDRGASSTTNNFNDNNTLYGEITPCYIVLPPETISEIFHCFPKLKLIFIARDMVDRVWSAMIMELRDQNMGRSPGEFADGGVVLEDDTKIAKKVLLAKEGTRRSSSVMSVAQQRRLQHQSLPSSQSDAYFIERLRSETHTSRSDYATHLRHWYMHFPAKNILIIDYREIEKNPRGVLIAVLAHIGLEEAEARGHVMNLHDEDVRQRVNAATTTSADTIQSSSSSSSSSQELLSHRPSLKNKIHEYVRPFAVDFNLMLEEQGYTWRLNE